MASFLAQPGRTLPLTENLILDATFTFAVITTAVLNVAFVAAPDNARELKEEVSTTSVTVMVIAWVPAFPAVSTARSVIS